MCGGSAPWTSEPEEGRERKERGGEARVERRGRKMRRGRGQESKGDTKERRV